MPAYIHHKEIALYAKDAAETDKPWLRWETEYSSGWEQCSGPIVFNPHYKYRRLPGKPFTAEDFRVDMRVVDKDGNVCFPIKAIPTESGKETIVDVIYMKGWAHPKQVRMHASSLFLDWSNYE